MTSHFQTTWIENASFRINERLNHQFDFSTRTINLDTCNDFMQRGICTALHSGVSKVFFKNAFQSGTLYIYLLQSCSNSDDLALSKGLPFFDAIAADHFDLAQQISQYSPNKINKRLEYEEDFFYYACIMSLFFQKPFPMTVEQMLEEWESLLTEDFDPRLDLIKAIISNEISDIEDAFIDFLNREITTIEAGIESGRIREEEWAWKRYVSVEGLALLRLLKQKQFVLNDIYHRIPQLLLKPIKVDAPLYAWKVG